LATRASSALSGSSAFDHEIKPRRIANLSRT
jgi:hypothetical protein